MKQNWQNGLDRFKALQTQARSTRDERNVLTKEVEELKAKLESGSGGEAAAAAIVRFPLFRSLASLRKFADHDFVLRRKHNLIRKPLSPNCKIASPPSKPRRMLSPPNSPSNKPAKRQTMNLSRLFKRSSRPSRRRKRSSLPRRIDSQLEKRLYSATTYVLSPPSICLLLLRLT